MPERILVTGSSGHLGEALMRTLRAQHCDVLGLDLIPSPWTDILASIVNRDALHNALRGVTHVLHTATLHKPHVATHTRQQFIDVNITGTLNLLEEAVSAGVSTFTFTSTTSAFGDALRPPAGSPAVWVTEDVHPVPRNIYGVTKVAAEDLCELFHRNHGLPCLILRTSRFFPEADDSKERRESFDDLNLKAIEFLYRRVELADVVAAHLLAMKQAPRLGFDRFIISATTPFQRDDRADLGHDAAAVVERRGRASYAELRRRGWSLPKSIDRVYVNERARQRLGWRPEFNFQTIIDRINRTGDYRSDLARAIGSKGYHDKVFDEGPFPVEPDAGPRRAN
ncbi:MAG TPA: NAD(P)-dependent oxidoreductase [Caulifigura sp.]|nr:NAD(P)-dependent oxidoreductase [Caulifigura sp.]